MPPKLIRKGNAWLLITVARTFCIFSSNSPAMGIKSISFLINLQWTFPFEHPTWLKMISCSSPSPKLASFQTHSFPHCHHPFPMFSDLQSFFDTTVYVTTVERWQTVQRMVPDIFFNVTVYIY